MTRSRLPPLVQLALGFVVALFLVPFGLLKACEANPPSLGKDECARVHPSTGPCPP